MQTIKETAQAATSEQDYMDMLAAEFASIPDREVVSSETQPEGEQIVGQKTTMPPTRREKNSTASTEVLVANTIRVAIAGINASR
ncbi:hypothetical protein N3K66_000530 [Trichothecium roseum]|uniref:Uncharacterized protein n=1 Tax=Trichothecium roseum TaxID=47278 RepID=A0ACC0VC23_9HYPO|nr:hypothetical protein N3K66_000530 [Trichothecium roseum]